MFTAPSLNTVVEEVQVVATPVGTDFGNAAARLVTVRLSAPGAAFPSFVFAPTAPEQFELTVFDASGTTMDGQACDSRCAYQWTFGSDGSGTGQVFSYRFRQAGAHTVTLTVTSPGGIVTRSQRSITVGAATLPTAEFTYSPTDPVIGDTVRFNADSSAPVPGSGATIVEYLWDFGNGSTASGRTASTSFPTAQTYVVRLTIRDSNGLTATVTQDVAISEP
jgi:PKD repeat protein